VIGEVDVDGRALITLKVRSGEDQNASELVAWVDTAFTGELVISQSEIQRLKLQQPGAIEAVLADGSTTVLKSYVAFCDWFDGLRAVEMIANEGGHPLLGIGLLRNRRLTVDYRSRQLMLD